MLEKFRKILKNIVLAIWALFTFAFAIKICIEIANFLDAPISFAAIVFMGLLALIMWLFGE